MEPVSGQAHSGRARLLWTCALYIDKGYVRADVAFNWAHSAIFALDQMKLFDIIFLTQKLAKVLFFK